MASMEEPKRRVHLSKNTAERGTVERAEEDLAEGKSASTAAGEFVREEIEHIREGKHGARSAKQAIAIGLSKARRAGVPLGVPKRGRVSEPTRKAAKRDAEKGTKRGQRGQPSKKRSRAVVEALKREPRSTVSKRALSKQAKSAAKKRKRSGPVTSTPRKRKAASKRSKRKRAAATQRRG